MSASEQSAVRLVAVEDLGDTHVTVVEDTPHGAIAVGMSKGQPFAVSNRCRHLFASLGNGRVTEEGCLECPWHAALFDVATGKMVRGPQGAFKPIAGAVKATTGARPLKTRVMKTYIKNDEMKIKYQIVYSLTLCLAGFTAQAQGTLDTSAAQLYVTQNAQLSGATVSVTVTEPSTFCVVSRFIMNSTAYRCLHLQPRVSWSGQVQVAATGSTRYRPLPLIDGTDHVPSFFRSIRATWAI